MLSTRNGKKNYTVPTVPMLLRRKISMSVTKFYGAPGTGKTRAWWIKATELKGKEPLLCTGGNGYAATTNEGY